MKKVKENTKLILAMFLGLILSTFSYCLADTITNSKNVYYEDNASLGVNNVQDAIDNTCVKFSEEVTNLKADIKKDILNETYPIGSIYISTKMTTAEQVETVIGGKWEVYGDGKTLLSSTGASGQTGGKNTITLTTDNLPSHTHSFTPAGSVSSTFKGTAVTSGGQSANHTHTFSGTTSTNGYHSHSIDSVLKWPVGGGGMSFAGWNSNNGYYNPVITSVTATGDHSHSYNGTTSANNVGHTHSVTAAGTVTSNFSGTASNTGSTGNGTEINIQNPYITVYMYQRVS